MKRRTVRRPSEESIQCADSKVICFSAKPINLTKTLTYQEEFKREGNFSLHKYFKSMSNHMSLKGVLEVNTVNHGTASN